MDQIIECFKDIIRFKSIEYLAGTDPRLQSTYIALVTISLSLIINFIRNDAIVREFVITRWRKLKYGYYYLPCVPENRDVITNETKRYKTFAINTLPCRNTSRIIRYQYERDHMIHIIHGLFHTTWADFMWYILSPDIHFPLYTSEKYGYLLLTLLPRNKDYGGSREQSLVLVAKNMRCAVEILKELRKKFPSISDKKEENKDDMVMIVKDFGNSDWKRTVPFNPSQFTIDRYVSRHKSNIVRRINNFNEANNGPENQLNGFKKKNLGILLHGWPGCGKTQLILTLCNILNRSPYIIDFKAVYQAKTLQECFTAENIKKYIFVMDEIDFVIGVQKRSHEYRQIIKQTALNMLENVFDENDNKQSDLTTPVPTILSEVSSKTRQREEIRSQLLKESQYIGLSTLLTLFDGVEKHEGRIVVATTNCIDKLDPALLRPSRFDLILELERFTHNECIELIEVIYKDNDGTREYLRKRLDEGIIFPDKKWSPSEIVELANNMDGCDLIDHLIK